MPIAKKMATLRELQEYYSMDDVINLCEIATVDSYNERILNDGDDN